MKIELNEAHRLLTTDSVVAIPTETVYGLAATYDNINGIHAVFNIKKRPLDNPLIIHLPLDYDINHIIQKPAPYLPQLVQHFWPGPLTIVCLKQANVDDLITAGQNTVAIRQPNHRLLQALLQKLNKPIVAPSANLFCQTSPTSAEDVADRLGDDIPVLDGGVCEVGIESTIVLATDSHKITILRQGMITASDIHNATGLPVITTKKISAIKTPGQHAVHYAPRIPCLVADKKTCEKLMKQNNKRFAFMLHSLEAKSSRHIVRQMPRTASAYAQRLYHTWIELEKERVDAIIIERVPECEQWLGVNDRISRATSS